ncbi:hypothetical protein [Actinokineospora sp. HUAS TT18]|uniref:hypothetical protein n=1 Tax=Actinokineospora sp. HUAS TT18 TaxID=3447451 RepID=UPI003F524205
MRTWVNVLLQLGAFVAFFALRLSAGGWLLIFYIVTVIGPVVTLAPLVTALVTAGRGRLPKRVWLPFAVAAAALVGAGALIADFGDAPGAFIPVVGEVAEDSGLMYLSTAGWVFALAFVVSVVWILVAVSETRKGRPAEAGRPS